MLAAELPRIETLPPLPPAPAEDDETRLGRELAEMLGYHVLDAERAKMDASRLKMLDEHTLFEALVAEGIRPFQTSNVREYMRKKLERAKRGFTDSGSVPRTMAADDGSLYHLPQQWGGDTDTDRWEWVEYYLGDRDSRKQATDRVDTRMAEFVAVSTGMNFTATSTFGSFGSALVYDKPVPKPVLEMALRLKRRLPDIDFRVHALERRRIYQDPFLEAIYKSAKFFIAVWDEPDFEAAYE